jgi:hypothetical protein
MVLMGMLAVVMGRLALMRGLECRRVVVLGDAATGTGTR